MHIEDLFTAFQNYQAECLRAQSLPVSQWGTAWKAAQERFKLACGPLADHIDWEERN